MNNDWVTSEPISEVRKIHYLSEKIGADGNGSLWDSIEQRSPWAVLLGLCESFFKPTKTKNWESQNSTRKSLAAGETSQKLIFDIFIVALFKQACKIIL